MSHINFIVSSLPLPFRFSAGRPQSAMVTLFQHGLCSSSLPFILSVILIFIILPLLIMTFFSRLSSSVPRDVFPPPTLVLIP